MGVGGLIDDMSTSFDWDVNNCLGVGGLHGDESADINKNVQNCIGAGSLKHSEGVNAEVRFYACFATLLRCTRACEKGVGGRRDSALRWGAT